MSTNEKKKFMGRAQMLFYAGIIVFAVGLIGMESILPLAWLLFVVTGYFYGQAKGYSSIVSGALGVFGALGLGVLLFMPDRNIVPATGEPVEEPEHTS